MTIDARYFTIIIVSLHDLRKKRKMAFLPYCKKKLNIKDMPNNYEVLTWVNLADEDYIASRILYSKNKLIPATCMANTAIEKYLKALLTYKGICFQFTHNSASLYRKISGNIPSLKLNIEYLNLLNKFYNLRYPDTFNIGDNLHINKVKMLVEMDYSVFTIRNGFQFKKKNGQSVTTMFDNMLLNKDIDLIQDNCYYGSAIRSELFKKQTRCFEIRILDDGSDLRAIYETLNTNDDGLFNLIALKPKRTSS